MTACPTPPSESAFSEQAGKSSRQEETLMNATAPSAASRPPREPLAALFRDVVLVLGGVFAIQGTDDETVKRVAAGLERVYRRARHSTPTREASPPRLDPHPAIADLLRLTEDEEAQP